MAAGGGGGEPIVGIDRGGVTISQGPINGFGSVIVNGVRYSTTGATITIDDRPGTESDLRAGQVVRVEGTVDATGTAGTARSISFNDDVEGPVQSIDPAAARLVVLGQTVQVGRATSFDDSISPRSLAGLAVGDRIEVSGLVNADWPDCGDPHRAQAPVGVGRGQGLGERRRQQRPAAPHQPAVGRLLDRAAEQFRQRAPRRTATSSRPTAAWMLPAC